MRAGPQRRVEREHVVVGLGEGDAVGLEARAEVVHDACGIDAQAAFAVSLKQGRLHRVRHARQGVVGACHRQAVDEQTEVCCLAGFVGLRGSQIVVHAQHFTLAVQTCQALLHEYADVFAQRAAFGHVQRGQKGEACAVGVGECALHHVVGRMALHLAAADGRYGVPDAGKEHAQVVVNLRACAHRRTRVAARHLLLNGDGRRQTLDVVAFGLVHTAQKLAGVGREALHVAPLPFGIERVESQRRFTRARESGNHHQFVARDVYVDVFEVVHPCALHADAVVHVLLCCRRGKVSASRVKSKTKGRRFFVLLFRGAA